jgi:hypothetical protein
LKARAGRERGIGLAADVFESPPTAKKHVLAGIAARKSNSFKSVLAKQEGRDYADTKDFYAT